MSMSPKEFGFALHVLGWTGRGLADTLGVDEKRIRRWLDERDSAVPPPEVAEWLRTLTRFWLKNPPPVIDPTRTQAAKERRSAARRRREAPGRLMVEAAHLAGLLQGASAGVPAEEGLD